MQNPNSHLDAQNPEHALAFVTPEEHAEYQAWLDSRNPISVPIVANTTAFEVAVKQLDSRAMNLAMEFGFLCRENGMNMDEAKARFQKVSQ